MGAKQGAFDCYTSEAVLYELESGEHPNKEDKVALIEDCVLLEITDDVREIVEVYIAHYLMPRDELGGALHLAVASYHKMDYLLTWNCNHLANANERRHIRSINERLRMHTPEILTPLELMGS